MKRLSIIEQNLIDEYLTRGEELDVLQNLEAKDLILLMRTNLRLTQRQLAKRAKVTQSTIARIEKGDMDPTFSLVKKLFDAMACDLYILPKPRVYPTDLLRQQAQKVAERRLNYVKGTMALEEQQLEKKWEKKLLEREVEDILKHDSDIWENDS